VIAEFRDPPLWTSNSSLFTNWSRQRPTTRFGRKANFSYLPISKNTNSFVIGAAPQPIIPEVLKMVQKGKKVQKVKRYKRKKVTKTAFFSSEVFYNQHRGANAYSQAENQKKNYF
jgi:hypothetical protein